jgi:hypothetical protein
VKTVKRSPGNASNLTAHLELAHVKHRKTLRELDERQKRNAELAAYTRIRKQPTITSVMEQATPCIDGNPKGQRINHSLLGPYCRVTTGFPLMTKDIPVSTKTTVPVLPLLS